MGPFVYYQFTTCFKCFSALITMKTFLTSLGTSVYHLMMIMLKYFWTGKRFLTNMGFLLCTTILTTCIKV